MRCFAFLLATFPILALATAAMDDSNIWLEELATPRVIEWVNAHNAATTKILQADPRYQSLYDQALAVANSKDRIPIPTFTHGAVYNVWNDEDHLRGIWRKTTLLDYYLDSPHWTTVLDIDALGKAEGKSWVLKDITCFRPAERRCLISLSDGGEDAVEIREFDLDLGHFVAGGFHLPRGKHRIDWDDENHLLVATDWTSGDLTLSGYPYIVKRLARSEPLSAAMEIFHGEKFDGGYGVTPTVLRDFQGNRLTVIERPHDTFHSEFYVVTPRGAERLAIPEETQVVELIAGRVIISLNEPWETGAASFPAGAIVDLDLAAVTADPSKPVPHLVWAPGPRDAATFIASASGNKGAPATATRDKLLVNTLHNVQARLLVFTPKPDGSWSSRPLAVPDQLALNMLEPDRETNRTFLTLSGFLTPTTLYLADAETGNLTTLKSLSPKFFDRQEMIEQHEATSTDGMKIPYFLVHRRDAKLDGSIPTLMTAYGGFQISRTPYYLAAVGKLWLERGGAFVLANIRGGGEFGPAWHEAGLASKRQIIYDDFAAVAKDLIARGITSPHRLGIQGESNGSLLMGVEMTQHPDLWNAVVMQVPLLDMIRIAKIAAGASWQGEYGDVNTNPAIMAFWQKTSPYQNLRRNVSYPEPFFVTDTKDDRVGPQHARKFAARMEQMGLPFYYYENTEGGHGRGADLKQAVHTQALIMTYLQRKLMD